jgi:predicted permease
MSTFLNDIKYAIRQLAKSPGFTAVAVISLAIGIGVNTLMFSVVNALMFQPIQVKNPDRLVYCGFHTSGSYDGAFGYEMYTHMRHDNPVFSDVIAFHPYYRGGTWLQSSVTKQMNIMYVSANYFSALGVKPVYGRTFLPEEEHYGSDLVTVLSYRTWKELGGEPNMVGQIVQINKQPCRIVGITPKGFTGTTITGPDIWMPLGDYGPILGQVIPGPYPYLNLIGRLKPNLDMAAAEARLQVLTPRLKEMNRFYKNDPKVKIFLTRLGRLSFEQDDPGKMKRMSYVSWILMGISSVILLIACLNLANMLNVQGTQRQREIAIRLAIGGGRFHIIRLLLIESLMLALFGMVLALILAWPGIHLFNAWNGLRGIPVQIPVSFDLRVLGVTFGFCLISTLLFGLKPAINLSRRDVIGDLKDAGVGMIRATKHRLHFIPRGLSVISQIALSVAFVMVAMLFVRTALKVTNTCPGFDLKDKIVVKIDALAHGYTCAQAKAACVTLGERLESMSGIQAVGWSRGFPIDDTNPGLSGKFMEYTPGDENENTKSLLRRGPMVFSIDGDYFNAMDLSLLQGRTFDSLDSQAKSQPPIIIDQSLAHKLRRDNSVLGCLVQHGWDPDFQVCRVAGVVPNQQDPSGATSTWAHFYQPMPADQVPIYMHVRTSSGMMSPLLQSLGSTIRQIDPQIKVVSLMSLAEHHRRGSTVKGAKIMAQAITLFGALAMFLAGLGLYAVMGHMVATRTSEIGLRMALGARRWDVLVLVFRQNAVSTLVGLVLGILLAIGLSFLIRSRLYGINPTDPMSIAFTLIALAMMSLLAGYIPARRAVKIDPMEALRYE